MKGFFFAFVVFLLAYPGMEVCSQSKNTATGQAESFELEVEEFMAVMDYIFSQEMVDEITFNLPEKLKIINYSVGDFSGDGLYDVAISYKKPKAPSKTYSVVLMVNTGNSFKNAGEFEAKWKDLPIDIGFVIKDGKCSVTHRVGSTWHFTTYIYADDALRLISDEEYK